MRLTRQEIVGIRMEGEGRLWSANSLWNVCCLSFLMAWQYLNKEESDILCISDFCKLSSTASPFFISVRLKQHPRWRAPSTFGSYSQTTTKSAAVSLHCHCISRLTHSTRQHTLRTSVELGFQSSLIPLTYCTTSSMYPKMVVATNKVHVTPDYDVAQLGFKVLNSCLSILLKSLWT